MKVKELIEILKTCDPELKVVLSSDGEGNSYSPVDGYNDKYYYFPESAWSGEVLSKEDLEEDEQDYQETDRCVVLYPVN